MPRGAPSKFTEQRVNAILRAVQLGATYEQAARSAGIHIDTMIEWRKQHSEFSDALKTAEARGITDRLRRIQNAAKKGTWQADAWWLERKYPAEWGRREHVEVEQHSTVDVQVLAEVAAVIRQQLRVVDAQLSSSSGEQYAAALALEQLSYAEGGDQPPPHVEEQRDGDGDGTA
jgi:transposase